MVKPEEHLLREIRDLYEAMYLYDSKAAKLIGVHVSDIRAVNALEDGPLSAGELGTRLGLTSGSVTTLIDRLEKAGFAERKRSELDHRRIEVELKPEFYAVTSRVYGSLGKSLAQQFSELSNKDLKTVTQVLRKLSSGFDNAV